MLKKIFFILFVCSILINAQVLKSGSGVSPTGVFWNGLYIYGQAGDTISFNELVYLNIDNKFYPVYPDSTNHFESKQGVVLADTIFPNNHGNILIEGFMKDTSQTYTPGTDIWADTSSTTAETVPFDDEKVTKKVGFTVNEDVIYIDPNANTYYWDDLRFPISAVRLPGSGAPTATSYVGSQVLAFPTNADATIYFVAQMPHAWIEGTDLGIHIHYALDTDGSNPDSVRFVFTYSWADISEAIVEPTTDQTTINVSAQTDSLHYLQELLDITGTGKTLSSILLCSLTRDVSEDDYGGNVYLMEIDIHYQTDGKGSRLESAK